MGDSVEQQNTNDLDSFATLRDRTSELETRLHNVDQTLQVQGNNLASTYKDVQHLKTWTEQVKDLEHVHTQQLEMTSSIKEQAGRIDKIEVDILQVQSDLSSEKQQQNSEFCGLEERIAKNISEILKWKDTLKGQCDILCTTSERLDDLESGQSKLLVRADTTDKEIQNLTSWQHNTTKQNDTFASMLEAARGDLLVVHEKNAVNSTSIQNLAAEMGNNQELLTKVSARVDMCAKYFNGLGKGLQDTHRQIVNGEHGLLPPKGGAMLPAIPLPKTPRNNSNERTPRKRSCPPLQTA